MSWNPSGNGKNPWGNNQGPPDLDEILRNIQRRVRARFNKGPGLNLPSGGGKWLWLIPLIAALIWAATGFYRVDSAERAVVLRFGSYQTTTGPGLHWHWPWPMAQALVVNVAKVRSFSYSNEMLTEDENIVQIAIAVQYVVDDLYQYLFGVRRPNLTLGEVAESAIRSVAGRNEMNFILGKGQSEVASSTRELMQSILDHYSAGLRVLSVNLQKDQPPQQVQEAFDDVNKAREDKQRLQNEARRHANKVIPKAKGQAARIVQDAEAYKAKVIADAKGRSNRFESVLAQYRKAPDVTRTRLYIDGIERLLKDTPTLLIDPSAKGSLLYMPLDRLFKTMPGSADKRSTP